MKLPASPATAFEHTVLYTTMSDAALAPHTGEVAALEIYSRDELQAELARTGDNLSPPFRELLVWWIAQSNG